VRSKNFISFGRLERSSRLSQLCICDAGRGVQSARMGCDGHSPQTDKPLECIGGSEACKGIAMSTALQPMLAVHVV